MFHFSGDEMTTSGLALWNHFPERSKLHFLVHLEHWKVSAQKPVSRSLFSNINTREFMNLNFQFKLCCLPFIICKYGVSPSALPLPGFESAVSALLHVNVVESLCGLAF